ncbi:hypothetical protein SAMN04489868_10760 [Pisciglobus halotolerans]|uniref:Uncharacterized protein n=1 Tax=Pisciglobus halotolerans TaxID=745365 RepID=A0A1I3BKI7_9LACT|nr:hypothetical protein SAMN04489868_10760 [Pisciglobus halotolerans]
MSCDLIQHLTCLNAGKQQGPACKGELFLYLDRNKGSQMEGESIYD